MFREGEPMDSTDSAVVRNFPFFSFQPSEKLEVMCGNGLLGEIVSRAVATNIYNLAHPKVCLILDIPWGFAYRAFSKVNTTSVIFTDNPCGEYVEDLWSLNPTALVDAKVSLDELSSCVIRASKGKKQKLVSYYESPLTCTERLVLKSCALAQSNKELAKSLGVTESTIKNTLNSIYSKLKLKRRSELALLYWGIQEEMDD